MLGFVKSIFPQIWSDHFSAQSAYTTQQIYRLFIDNVCPRDFFVCNLKVSILTNHAGRIEWSYSRVKGNLYCEKIQSFLYITYSDQI